MENGEEDKKTGLILTMKIGESFFIDARTCVSYEGRAGNQIKIRIKAPKEVKILTSRLCDRLARKAKGQ